VQQRSLWFSQLLEFNWHVLKVYIHEFAKFHVKQDSELIIVSYLNKYFGMLPYASSSSSSLIVGKWRLYLTMISEEERSGDSCARKSIPESLNALYCAGKESECERQALSLHTL